VITSDAGGDLVGLAWEMGVVVATAPRGEGAIAGDGSLGVGVIGCHMGHLP
jgi:hypothetical protein